MATSSDKFKNDKNEVTKIAEHLVKTNAFVLDTETTGLGEKDEIVEIFVIDVQGNVAIDTLIRPTIPITPSASAIHEITNLDISNAPYITEIITGLNQLLQNNPIAIYNAEFDLRMLRQSLSAHGQKLPDNLQDNIFCIMELYAIFNGEFDETQSVYKWIKLSDAAANLGIRVPGHLHRARTDAELTREVILKIANSR